MNFWSDEAFFKAMAICVNRIYFNYFNILIKYSLSWLEQWTRKIQLKQECHCLCYLYFQWLWFQLFCLISWDALLAGSLREQNINSTTPTVQPSPAVAQSTTGVRGEGGAGTGPDQTLPPSVRSCARRTASVVTGSMTDSALWYEQWNYITH